MRTLALTTKAKMAIFNLAHEIMSRDVLVVPVEHNRAYSGVFFVIARV